MTIFYFMIALAALLVFSAQLADTLGKRIALEHQPVRKAFFSDTGIELLLVCMLIVFLILTHP